jgi:hypothetical protein
MPVDTAKVKDRRKVEYKSLQDVLADAERLNKGPIKTLGNWSPGQVYSHLAKAMNDSIDGSDVKVSWFMRLIARSMKKKILSGPMSPGFKLPADAQRVLVPGPTSTEDGLAALRAAIARLQTESKRAPSPAFGPMTREEWDKLHLNHAALHMSFLSPQT